MRLKVVVYINERVAQLLFRFLNNLLIRKTATTIAVCYLEVIDFFTSATLVAVLVITVQTCDIQYLFIFSSAICFVGSEFTWRNVWKLKYFFRKNVFYG